MSQVIAGIYEIQQQIGAGGGGVVYLGKHLRLNKQIVLKADKRSLEAEPEVLRREVDLLKGLSHSYIPQVYDFVQEDNTVYTVMDYIEGESFDKILKSGRTLTQPEIVRWLDELLQALVYLHGRPPHGILHGDIKPANVMLRPNGEICLIDYNIALALGENGAVKVGFSRGYASPEHYGSAYTPQEQTPIVQGVTIQMPQEHTLVMPQDSKTEVLMPGAISISTGSSAHKTLGMGDVRLDVRSDIYSLGATMYHLLCGKRPAVDALEVEPLGADVCSQELADIINKSMSPLPENRYQTAQEMLNAIRNLGKTEITKLKKKAMCGGVAALVLLLAGGSCIAIGQKKIESTQEYLTLAEYSADALEQGNVTQAVSYALQALPTDGGLLDGAVTAQAQKALSDALGVYDLSEDYHALDVITLPSAPFQIVLSPAGTYLAAVYAYETAVYRMDTLEQITALPMIQSALAECCFTDETHLLYAGENGISFYDLEEQRTVWTGETATAIAVSADGSTAAAVERDAEYAILYDVQDGSKIARVDFYGQHMKIPANDMFANANDQIFALNRNGSLLAVSFDGGGLYLFDTQNPQEDLIIYEESDYSVFSGGFCGDIFAGTSRNGQETVFMLIDTAQASYIGGFSSADEMIAHASEQGIYLACGGTLTEIDTQALAEQEVIYIEDKNIVSFDVGKQYRMAATDDQCFAFYDSAGNLISTWQGTHECEFTALAGDYAVAANRSEPELRLLKLDAHTEAQLVHYDAQYQHDEARLSSDGETVMLFSYQGFQIYDMEGNVLGELELPNAEQIYDQQFRREDGDSWLEVTWYDGSVRCYSAMDGSLISQQQIEPPDQSLYEEFITDDYKVVSALHEAPKVYCGDNYVCNLESEDYLTYVTQSGDYLITEYINTAGDRYGLVLDDNMEQIAYLPDLCDVIGDKLVFDYESGNLRQCRLYSLQELIALGETYITKGE